MTSAILGSSGYTNLKTKKMDMLLAAIPLVVKTIFGCTAFMKTMLLDAIFFVVITILLSNVFVVLHKYLYLPQIKIYISDG